MPFDNENNVIKTAKIKKGRSKSHGNKIVRTDSRAQGNITQFTTCSDNLKIGDGQTTFWDFSNANNDSTDETAKLIPTGYKRKRLILKFADDIQIKEGTIYFSKAKKSQYLDFYVICPNGQVYLDRSGNQQVAAGDVVIEHYVCEQYIQGDVLMGDELNTEGASEDSIPTNYELWIEITTLITDVDSNGWATLEIYRPRTVLFPGEAL